MVDRRWLGDLGLAILFTLPTASLALPPSAHQPNTAPVAAKNSSAERIAASGRISLLG